MSQPLARRGSSTPHPVLEIDYRGYYGMRTKDILGEELGRQPKKRSPHQNLRKLRFSLFAVGGPKLISITDDPHEPALCKEDSNRTILTGLRQA